MLENKFRLLVILILFIMLFNITSFAQNEFIYDAKGERNPFMPLITDEGMLIKIKPRLTSSNLELEGIIFDNVSMSYAIVNGAVVKVGDFVGDYQVLRIQADKVIFIKDGEPFEVELEKEEG